MFDLRTVKIFLLLLTTGILTEWLSSLMANLLSDLPIGRYFFSINNFIHAIIFFPAMLLADLGFIGIIERVGMSCFNNAFSLTLFGGLLLTLFWYTLAYWLGRYLK